MSPHPLLIAIFTAHAMSTGFRKPNQDFLEEVGEDRLVQAYKFRWPVIAMGISLGLMSTFHSDVNSDHIPDQAYHH